MKTLSRKLFYENIVFNFYLDHVIDDNGYEVKEYFVMQPKNIRLDLSGGVAILPIIDKKIGLIKIFRPAMKQAQWEIPHGFIELDESDEVAASRELREETGLVVDTKNIYSLGFVSPDSGVIAAKVKLFAVEIGSLKNEITYELGLEKFSFFDIFEVKEMIRSSEIHDSFTISAMFKFLLLKNKIKWEI